MGLDSRPQNYRRNDNMPADFKKMYLQMAGKVDDALAMLDKGADPRDIRLLLQNAMDEAEEIYIQTDDTEEE